MAMSRLVLLVGETGYLSNSSRRAGVVALGSDGGLLADSTRGGYLYLDAWYWHTIQIDRRRGIGPVTRPGRSGSADSAPNGRQYPSTSFSPCQLIQIVSIVSTAHRSEWRMSTRDRIHLIHPPGWITLLDQDIANGCILM
jgi:hypothetical protein